jgi:hypothetical protein
MSDFFTGGFGAMLGGGAGLMSGLLGRQTANRNLQLQKRAFEHQVFMDKNQVWQRAQDLKQSGLSKTLAAGGSSGSSVSSAPQLEAGNEQVIDKAMAGAMQGNQIAQTKAQNELLQAQTNNVNADTTGKGIANQTAQLQLQINRALKDFTIEQAQLDTKIRRQQLNQETYRTIGAMLDNTLKAANIRGAHRDNLIKSATYRLMKIEQTNKEWYHSIGVPYDIGWDISMRATTMLVAAIKQKINEQLAKKKPPKQQPETTPNPEDIQEIERSLEGPTQSPWGNQQGAWPPQ